MSGESNALRWFEMDALDAVLPALGADESLLCLGRKRALPARHCSESAPDSGLEAARTGRTLTAVIEEALRAALAPRRARGRERVELPTFGSGGLLPGVDLDDTASLLDAMEDRR